MNTCVHMLSTLTVVPDAVVVVVVAVAQIAQATLLHLARLRLVERKRHKSCSAPCGMLRFIAATTAGFCCCCCCCCLFWLKTILKSLARASAAESIVHQIKTIHVLC